MCISFQGLKASNTILQIFSFILNNNNIQTCVNSTNNMGFFLFKYTKTNQLIKNVLYCYNQAIALTVHLELSLNAQ